MTLCEVAIGPGSVPLTDIHEHAWRVESGHRTSTGRVLYVRCVACGVRRMDLQDHPLVPPNALSATIGRTISAG